MKEPKGEWKKLQGIKKFLLNFFVFRKVSEIPNGNFLTCRNKNKKSKKQFFTI